MARLVGVRSRSGAGSVESGPDDVDEVLAAAPAGELIRYQFCCAGVASRRIAGDVGREAQQARGLPQRMGLREWLGVNDIEHRPQPAGTELGRQRVSVDDCPASGIDQQRTISHALQRVGADQSACGIRKRCEHDDRIGPRQKFPQLVGSVEVPVSVRADTDDPRTQRS